MKDSLRKKIKYVLHTVLETLTTLEQSGYLSPRVWGSLLIVGVVGLMVSAQYNIFSAPPENSAQTPPPRSTPINREASLDAEASNDEDALPLQSAPTATALRLLALTPLPPPTPPFALHIVEEQETLIAIAAEYGVTTEAILTTNDIRDPTKLEIGQPLLIPPPDGLSVPVVLHRVRPGETLLSIAMQYGSSQKDILAANPGSDANSLRVDQTLVVPIIFNQPKPVPRSENSDEPLRYIVQTGDIPLTIAGQFDVPVELLLASNNITDPTRLQVGQNIVIPPYEGESFSFPVVLHELVEDNTLLDIAIRYGSSVKDILAVNPDLIPSALESGQVVAVPIVFSQPRPTPVPDADEAPPAPIEVSGPLVDLQQQMFEAVNAERVANGLPPYEFDEALASVALKHAQDMVERQYLAHVTPEGNTVRDRIEADGIGDAFRVGENIQVNTKPREQTVGEALTWFLSSAPHRRGLLHQYYNRIGIGIVNGPTDWHTFVLVFAER